MDEIYPSLIHHFSIHLSLLSSIKLLVHLIFPYITKTNKAVYYEQYCTNGCIYQNIACIGDGVRV